MLQWTRGLVSGLVGLAISTTALGQPVEFRAGDSLYRKSRDWLVGEGVANPTEEQISAVIEHVMKDPNNAGKIFDGGNRVEVGVILELPANGTAIGSWTGDVYTAVDHPAIFSDLGEYFSNRYRMHLSGESSMIDVDWAKLDGTTVRAESVLLKDELRKRDRTALVFKEQGLIQTIVPFEYKAQPWGSDSPEGPSFMGKAPEGAVWFSDKPVQGAYRMPSAFMPILGR